MLVPKDLFLDVALAVLLKPRIMTVQTTAVGGTEKVCRFSLCIYNKGFIYLTSSPAYSITIIIFGLKKMDNCFTPTTHLQSCFHGQPSKVQNIYRGDRNWSAPRS